MNSAFPLPVRNVEAKGGVKDPATTAVCWRIQGANAIPEGGQASFGGQGLCVWEMAVGSGGMERAGKVSGQVRGRIGMPLQRAFSLVHRRHSEGFTRRNQVARF